MRTLWKRPKRPITWWNWKQETGKWNCVSSPTALSCKLQACLPFHWIYIARTYARPYARPYVRACVYILCVFLPPLFSFKKSCSATCLSISHLWKSFDISDKKVLVYLVRIPKSATFASAFENGGSDSLTFWQKRSRNPSFFLVIWCCLFHEWRL